MQMEQSNSIILYEESKGLTETTVTAKIDKARLEIFGHVFDDSAMTCSCRDEREYLYELNEEDTARLIEIITKDGRDLKVSLIDNFGGETGIERFKKFCDKNKLKYEYRSRP